MPPKNRPWSTKTLDVPPGERDGEHDRRHPEDQPDDEHDQVPAGRPRRAVQRVVGDERRHLVLGHLGLGEPDQVGTPAADQPAGQPGGQHHERERHREHRQRDERRHREHEQHPVADRPAAEPEHRLDDDRDHRGGQPEQHAR